MALSPFQLIRKTSASIIDKGKSALSLGGDLFFPPRGYEEELNEPLFTRKTTLPSGQTVNVPKPPPNISYKDQTMGTIKEVTEIYTGLGRLGEMVVNKLPGYNAVFDKIAETKTGGLLGGVFPKIQEFQQPKTLGEAQTMRGLDVLSVFPLGLTKNISNVSRVISKTDDVNRIYKELKGVGLTDEIAKAEAPRFTQITDEKQIADRISNQFKPQQLDLKGKPNIDLEPRKIELEIRKDLLFDSPFHGVVKSKDNFTIFNREGDIRELADIKNPATIRRLEDILAETGYKDNPKGFVDDFAEWNKSKKTLALEEKEIRALEKTFPQAPAVIKSVTKPIKKTEDIIKNPTPPPRTKLDVVKRSDFDKTPLRDIGGFAGGKSFNMRDAAWAIDNIGARELAQRGTVGPTVKAFNNFKRAETEMIEWIQKHERNLATIFNKISKTDLKQIAEYRLASPATKPILPKNLQVANKQITEVTDAIRNDYNAWAKKTGQKEIGYVDDYLTKKMEPNDILSPRKPGISDSFTKERFGGELPGTQQKNMSKILASYVNSVARKMYLESSVKQLKSVGKELGSRGIKRGSKFIDDFIDETLRFNATDTIAAKAAQAFISARSTAALAFNVVWSTFVQPLSLALTFGRNPNAKAITKGIYNAFADKRTKNWVKKLPTYRQKVDIPMSATGLGDIGTVGIRGKIGGTREKVNRVLGWYADTVEETLSRVSASVAKEYGEKLGMRGSVLDDYADLMIGATQSEYTKTARPEALRALWVRVLAPFQTYAFESYRFGKTVAGLPGGIPIKAKADRFKQVVVMYASMEAMNWMQEQATGRRVTTPGSFVPLVGPVVDEGLKSLAGTVTGEDQQYGGRSPVSVYEDYKTATDAIGTYIEHGNIHPLRKQLTKWGMGFTGVAGASTANRLIDGIIANAKGYQTTRSGDPAFYLEGKDKIVAPVLGPYSTKSGKEYIEGGYEKISEAETVYKSLQQHPMEERIQALKVMEKSNPSLFTAIKKYSADLKSGITSEEETLRGLGVTNKERASTIYRELDNFDTGAEQKAYLRDLEAKKVITDKVKEQVISMIKGDINPNSIKDERSKIGFMVDYGKALIKDPVNALRVLGKEKLGRVQGNLVELERDFDEEYYNDDFTLNEKGGAEITKRLAEELGIPVDQLPNFRREHIVPVKAGGSNSDSNFQIIPTELHKSYTGWDIRAGNKVKAGVMTRREVAKIAKQLKVEMSITVEEAIEMLQK